MESLFLASTLTNDQTLALIGLIVALTGIILFLLIFIFIIQIFARWRVFAKMGIPSWKALIPIYSDYCLWSGVWNKKMFWVNFIIELIIYAITSYVKKYANASASQIPTSVFVLSLILLALGIILLVFTIMFVSNYSKAFGHGVGFALGLFFFSSIFELIIGFGASQYVGNKST